MILNDNKILTMLMKGKGFEHKGEYDTTAIYENTHQRIDCVSYGGSTYYCKMTTTAGILPTNTNYFGILANSGEKGKDGYQPIDAYPIGSIYLTVETTTTGIISPASFLGGTWEQIKDRFLLGAGDTYAAGSEGGSADAVIVAHKHSFKMSNDGVGSNGYIQMTKGSAEYVQSSPIANTVDLNDQDITEDGVGKNMPPYLTVYMWKRVAQGVDYASI